MFYLIAIVLFILSTAIFMYIALILLQIALLCHKWKAAAFIMLAILVALGGIGGFYGVSEYADYKTKRAIVDLGGTITLIETVDEFRYFETTFPKATDETLAQLSVLRSFTVSDYLSSLDFSGSQVTDQGMRYLQSIPSLTTLSLDNTTIGDAGLKTLAQTGSIRHLSVAHTKVTNAGILYFASHNKHLQFLDVTGAQVTEQDVKQLKTLLPEIRIRCDQFTRIIIE